MKEMRGRGKEYEVMPVEDLYTLIGTCQNIEDELLLHKDFINAIFLTNNIPSSTAYIPNGLNVNGTPMTILWLGGAGSPSGNANQVDIISFTLIRVSSSWTVLGSLGTYA
jgi:hypothetical protein